MRKLIKNIFLKSRTKLALEIKQLEDDLDRIKWHVMELVSVIERERDFNLNSRMRRRNRANRKQKKS